MMRSIPSSPGEPRAEPARQDAAERGGWRTQRTPRCSRWRNQGRWFCSNIENVKLLWFSWDPLWPCLLTRSWWRDKRSWTRARGGRWGWRSGAGGRIAVSSTTTKTKTKTKTSSLTINDKVNVITTLNHWQVFYWSAGNQWRDSWARLRRDWKSLRGC